MKLKDIKTDIKTNFILCTYYCTDGSIIKEKYIHYNLSEAKKTFLNKFKNL